MKKLINEPDAVVREMLEGAVALAPGQALLASENVVVRLPLPFGAALDRRSGLAQDTNASGRHVAAAGRPAAPDETGKSASSPTASWPVAILSGGGSGHEPAHAGFVGDGMLAAAIAGPVFTSPSVDAVLTGLRAVAGPAGALTIVKNYTGDRLNFGLAAELARAEGIPVEIVVVADDVALRDTVERGRRRGIAGTVLVHKVAGAAAASGLPLQAVTAVAQRAADNLGSMGVALGGCTLPGSEQDGFALGDHEIELGLGIHGEPGVRRTHMMPADELARLMIDAVAGDLSLRDGERVALLVNGLGGTPEMELDIVLRGALAHLRGGRIEVARAWRGTLLSALDMPGCSISLLRLDDELIGFLDAPTSAPAWPGGGRLNGAPVLPGSGQAPDPEPPPETGAPASPAGQRVRAAAAAAAHALLAAEPQLTDLDTRAGDGDLGASMSRAARAVLDLPDAAWVSPTGALAAMSASLRRAIGGSSGPFYATALLRASRHLAGADRQTAEQWAEALAVATQAISELGGARRGDRTMVDALSPAAEALSQAITAGVSQSEALRACAAAARQGADATAGMSPRLGRSSYLGERAIGVPDGGAVAVSIWLSAVCEAVAGDAAAPETDH